MAHAKNPFLRWKGVYPACALAALTAIKLAARARIFLLAGTLAQMAR
ncbi:hypothetical protein [Erythrobacter sp. R86502]